MLFIIETFFFVVDINSSIKSFNQTQSFALDRCQKQYLQSFTNKY